MSAPLAILVDLDGTTFRENIYLPQAAALTQAITVTFGFDAGIGPDDVPDRVQVDWTGKTDYQIVLDMCERAGRDATMLQHFDDFHKAYTEMCWARFPTNMRGQVRPSIRTLLEEVTGAGIEARVVTGNLREVATWKLERSGLSHFYNMEQSATGTESFQRSGLCSHAAKGTRAALVIGDTWRDVEGAHAAGLPCVALATPKHDVAELQAAGAEAVVDADDADAIHRAVLALLREGVPA